MILNNLITESTSDEELLHILSSVPALRTRQNLLKLAPIPDLAFKALRLIPQAIDCDELVKSAAAVPRNARLIVEDLPKYRTEEIFKLAVNDEKEWALKYKIDFDLDFNWLNTLLKPVRENMDQSTSI